MFYLFIYFILFLMLRITEQILLTIKNSNKMLVDVNTLTLASTLFKGAL